MCGIAGWFATAVDSTPPEVLDRMTDALVHRGPDGRGVHRDGACAFGHRRLSIVDLEGGRQPMASADGRFVTTFNGEIYNHQELRRDLRARGRTFRTSSDTEVIVEGAEVWGDALPAHLAGMFAFGLWDRERRRGMLVRDRMGKKPLHYAHLPDGTLVFASEIKALLEHPGVSRTLDVEALALYLSHEYVPYPWTIFRDIRKLPPGTSLFWEDGRIRLDTWWTIPFGEPSAVDDPDEWFALLREAMSRAVERRLMSDVPLGVFLSGGIDSSILVAMMARHVPPREIETFSIAFEDASFDESRWAELVARTFGTRHRVRTLSPEVMRETLPTLLPRIDEPFADPSLLATHLLSAFTREHVTVALGGDGGDELFLGYETFRADTAADFYRRLPHGARDAIAAVVERLPVDSRNFSLDFVLKSFLRGADSVPELRHLRWLSSFIPNTNDDPLAPHLRRQVPDATVFGFMADAYLGCPDPDHRQRLSCMYQRTYMVEDILAKVDRASMATSLEVRSPFMDHEVVSLAARMPSSLKLRHGFVAKYALRKAFAREIPEAVLTRKKKGFGIPISAWLRGPLRGEMDRLLDPGRLADVGLFDADVVRRLRDDHVEGRRGLHKQLWTLMMFEAWRERWGGHV